MKATVKNVEDHRYFCHYVDVCYEGNWIRFDTAYRASGFLRDKREKDGPIEIEWIDITHTAKKSHVYPSYYTI